MNYYNEIDPGAAAWLRQLILAGEIPPGVVDTRSIVDVRPSDLIGFTQCHFFAGIGGWPLALRLAGIPATTRCWTGSPPCQPFSVAGRGGGARDSRHLAPAFLDLVAESRPPMLFGEQVKAAVNKDHWLDALLFELEEQAYICGSSVLPACGVGAPHQRDRIFFGACTLGDANSIGSVGRRFSQTGAVETRRGEKAFWLQQDQLIAGLRSTGFMANVSGVGREGRVSGRTGAQRQAVDGQTGCSGSAGNMGHADSPELEAWQLVGSGDEAGSGEPARAVLFDDGGQDHSFWSGADWLGCRDGKFRPVEPGSFPLANGVPARVGRLRGYGNAIVPQAAAAFVSDFILSLDELVRGDI